MHEPRETGSLYHVWQDYIWISIKLTRSNRMSTPTFWYIYLFVYLICVAANIMVRGNHAFPRETSHPCAGFWKTFPHMEEEKDGMFWTWTLWLDCFETPGSLCCAGALTKWTTKAPNTFWRQWPLPCTFMYPIYSDGFLQQAFWLEGAFHFISNVKM